jgi:hypothetical protein
MILYLYGPDSYKRQEKLKWYLQKFKEKHSALTVERFNLPEDLIKLKEFSTTQSLFDDFKFGVFDNITEVDPKELEGVFKLSLDSKNLTLAISADKELPKDWKILKEKQIIRHEFKEPTPAAFSKFVQEEAEKRKLKLSPANLQILVKNYRGDSWGIVTELDKLALGGSPDPFLEEQNFFDLVSRIQWPGAAAGRLPVLEKLLYNNEPAAVFNFLASRASGGMKKIMADYDVAIKSGRLEYEEVLLDAILT